MGAKAQELLLLIEAPRACFASSSLVRSIRGTVLTRATVSTIFGHCWIESLKKVTKSLLFILLNELVDLLDLKLLKL